MRAFNQSFVPFISEAVRNSHPEFLEKNYRISIVRWFDGAKDRCGGRKRRSLSSVPDSEFNTN